MHNWLAKPQLTDDLGDLDMGGDIETDSSVLAGQFRQGFSGERKLYRQNIATSECADPYSDFARERVASLARIFRGNWCGLGLMSSYVAG